MKTPVQSLFSLVLLAIVGALPAQELTPKEIIRKADERFNGEKTSISTMAMTIVRPPGKGPLSLRTGPAAGSMP
jgi:hypothetical protein